MKLNRRLVSIALVLGVLAMAAVFAASTSIARADEAELVVADASIVIQPADGDDPPPREPDPRDPEPGECVKACKERAQTWIRQCVANGGIRERCQEQGEKKAMQCIERCPPEARDPKPVPREPEPKKCVGECEKLAREYYGKCLRRTGGEKPAECKRKANRFLKACIERKCPREEREPGTGRVDPKPGEPAPAPEECVEKCAKTAREFLRKCEAGQLGRVAPEDCAKRARQMNQACVDKCPKVEPAPDPDPDACVERCKKLGQRTLRECLSTGAAKERCEQRAGLATRQCVADNCP